MQSFKSCEDFNLDKVFITSVKYQDEIRYNLMKIGFGNEQIETIDKMIFYLFDNANMIEQCIGGKGLEIGGPPSVFSYIYGICTECDGVNFCTDTVWWKQNSKNQYMYGNQILGKMYIADATSLTDIPNDYYDFVISSNNLEHIANPIKALSELNRVIKK